jgi:hypothetical protein
VSEGSLKVKLRLYLTLRAALILPQEVDVALEEDFNEAMLAMLRDLPMQDIYQVCGKHGWPHVVAVLLVR